MLFKSMSDFFVLFLIQQQINVTLRDNSAFMCFSAAPAFPLLYFIAPCSLSLNKCMEGGAVYRVVQEICGALKDFCLVLFLKGPSIYLCG